MHNNKSLNYFNRSLKKHLKINWKLLVSFAIIWLIISVAMTQMFGLGGHSGLYIAPNLTIEGNSEGSSSLTNKGYGQALDNVWGPFGFIFFSVISLILVFNTYIKDLKTGQITLWMTSGLSKNNVFLSKLILIFIINTLVFAPSFLLLIIIISFSKDANLYLGYMVLEGILFLLFNLFLSALYTLIGMLFINHSALFLIVGISLMLFIVITTILSLLYDLFTANKDLNSVPLLIRDLKYVKYFSLQSLYVPILQFKDLPLKDSSQETSMVLEEKITTITAEFYIKNKWWTVVAPFIVTGLNLVFSTTGNLIFKNHDLKI